MNCLMLVKIMFLEFNKLINLKCKKLSTIELNILFVKLNSTEYLDNLKELSIQNSHLNSLESLPKLSNLK